MAQYNKYGKNFFGASYYGVSGVFAGQFLSDRTALPEPLKYDPSQGLDGKLYFDIDCVLPWVEYKYTDCIVDFPVANPYTNSISDIFRYQGTWTDSGTSYYTSDTTFEVQAQIVCSDFKVNYVNRVDGAIVKIEWVKYVDGVPDESTRNSYILDTTAGSTYEVQNLPFGEYRITITYDPSSPSNSVFEFVSLEAMVTDISLETRYTTVDADIETNWSDWSIITLTRTNNGDGTYTLSGSTDNIQGAVGYQFKLLLATSDNTVTPEILQTDIHTSNVNKYAEDGFWKMLIDLGSDFDPASGDTIDYIAFTATQPEGTVLEIRTRTTDDASVEDPQMPDENVSWDYWSTPYSSASNRAIVNLRNVDLDSLTENDLVNGYIVEHITTPLMTPENLTHWLELLPTYYLNDTDPILKTPINNYVDSNTGEVVRNTYIKLKFLDADFNQITINNDIQEIILDTQEYNIEKLKYDIGQLDMPLRVRVEFYIKPGYSTPAIENIYMLCEAEYIEVKDFLDFTKPENEGKTGFEAYGSAVFNNNTGIDNVYLDGKTRTILASISNMNFTYPQGVTNPEFILSKLTNLEEGTSEYVNVYWASQENNINKNNITEDQNDYLKVEVKENGTTIKKYRHFGSGITVKLDAFGEKDIRTISSAFYPSLDTDKLTSGIYVYYLKNGFDDGSTVNTNVNLRWSSEDGLDDPPDNTAEPWLYRRYISFNNNENIYTSIKTAIKGELVRWVSEEKIFEGIVNIGSPVVNSDDETYPKKTIIEIADLPFIHGGVITSEDNPYKVEVVPSTVESEDEIKEDDRIEIYIDGVEYSSNPVKVENAKLIKSDTSEDPLFRTNITSIISIVKEDGGAQSTQFVEGVHYQIIDNKIDWSIGIDSGLTIPNAGDKLLVTYEYLQPTKIIVKAECHYNRKHYDKANIYKTSEVYRKGRCSFGSDYISEKIDIDELWPAIPDTVDRSTLELKVKPLDNDFINLYIKDNRVIGTLGFTNPKENWHPHIKGGYYSIDKNSYYLYTSPQEIAIGSSTVPIAENIEYTDGVLGQGLLIQEGTTNIVSNATFDLDDNVDVIFTDSFER